MEVTAITTLEVTKVYKDVPECLEIDKTVCGNNMKMMVELITGADNVVVTNVQQFDMDKDSKEDVAVDKWEELRKASRPLIEYIRRNWNPHTKVIVDIDSAEVVTGEMVEKFNL